MFYLVPVILLDSLTLTLLIAIPSSIALIAILIVLYFTLIRRSLLKKQSKEIIGVFEREHAVLFGDIDKYIKRLKAISELNLTYVESFTKWQMKFKDVRDGGDANAQNVANALKDALEARHWSEVKEFYPKAKATIEEYAERVDTLKKDLDGVFSIEEEVTSIALQEKTKCRNIKQKLFAKKDDLRLVSDSMNSLFKNIDEKITKADEEKDKACYEEAKDIYLNFVDKTLNQIDILLEILPNTCLELTNLLPDRISSLRNRYQKMVGEGYPLIHILTNKDIDAMEDEVAKMTQNIKLLNNSGIGKRIDALRNSIDTYNDEFDKEEEARKIFEQDYDSIYREENQVHQNFVNLSNSLDTIKTYYLLGAEDITKFNELSSSINSVSSSKTLLDNYVHSNSPQLFTVLVTKMNDLKEMVSKAKGQLTSFESYLLSLKKDTQDASILIKEYFKKTKDYESLLRSFLIPSLNKKFSQSFDELYSLIDTLYADIMKMPINVKKVQSDVKEIKEKGDSLFSEIDSINKNLHDAENSIVRVNRYRMEDASIDQSVSQAELLFQNASFNEAYLATKDITPPTKDN